MKNKRFVFDTNALVSASLSKKSTSRQAYELANRSGFLLYSNQTFNELQQVLERKKFDRFVSWETRTIFLNVFLLQGVAVKVISHIKVCRDPKDDMFLELAVDGQADYLISGDKDLLVLHPFQDIPIVTPAQFITEFEQLA